MADSYLAISQIANDSFMTERVRACATQQQEAGLDIDANTWPWENRYRWAASPTWGEKWDYALAAHEGDSPDAPPYEPGRDSAVITDGDILSTVQSLAGA